MASRTVIYFTPGELIGYLLFCVLLSAALSVLANWVDTTRYSALTWFSGIASLSCGGVLSVLVGDWSWLLPAAIVVFAVVAFPTFLVVDAIWYRGEMRARWKRRRRGRCPRCGYNLKGNVSGVCPECGQRMSAKSRRRLR